MGQDHGEVEHDCAYRVGGPVPINAHEQILREFKDGDTLILVRMWEGHQWAALYEHPVDRDRQRDKDRVVAFGLTPDDALVALAERIAARVPA